MGGLLPGNSPECMIKTLISNLSPERLMWLISFDAPRSSCDGPHSTRARLIFTVKWDIWFARRRPASSSNSYASRIVQNYTTSFFSPLACAPLSCANLSAVADNTSILWSLNKRICGFHVRFVERQWPHLLRFYKQVSSFSTANMLLCSYWWC